MLISCAAYQNGLKLAEIPKEEISEYVVRPDCFVWVALFEPTSEEMDEMAREFDLHELAVEDARHGHQRPKIEEYGDSLFAVLHTVEPQTSEDADGLSVGEISVFVGANYILTVRHRTKVGFAAVRARCEREPEMLRHGAGFVFYTLVDEIVDRYFPILDNLETQLEESEAQLFTGASTRDKIEEVYSLKRRLITLKHAVEPLMESVGKLHGGRVPHLCMGTQEYFRDVYDHLARINATIESIREMITTAIQVNIAFISLADSQITKRLAGWGAVIMIPTLIAGVYGMNFELMPELKSPYGYPLTIGVMLVVDALLIWRFRRAGWI